MNEWLDVDPNPSSFFLLFFYRHNITNHSSTIYINILVLVSYHPLLTTWTSKSKFDRTPSSNGTSGGQTQDRQAS